jgi:hypothetical protein
MKGRRLAVVTGALALASGSALASAPPSHPHGAHGATPQSNQGMAHRPSTPDRHAGLPAKAKAYGRYCQGEPKKHVKGMKGTPFSQCVRAMAKLAKGVTKSPRTACTAESKRHVKGQRGTPFSLCVSGGAKLLKHQHHQSGS